MSDTQDKHLPKIFSNPVYFVGGILTLSFALYVGLDTIVNKEPEPSSPQDQAISAAYRQQAEQRQKEVADKIRAVVNCYHQPPADPALCPPK